MYAARFRLLSWAIGPALAFALSACNGDAVSPQEPAPAATRSESLFKGTGIRAANIDELYAAINNPQNAGKQIILEPNLYVLDPGRPHGGRIELQQGMSLRGKEGHADSVVIDASGLDVASLTDGVLTGAIRVGRGANAVEWLTVRNVTQGAAAIETDLAGAGVSSVRIANVIAVNNQRGFDIRNVGPAMAHRRLEVQLVRNVLSDNTAGAGQGLRIVNQNTSAGVIHAALCNNEARGNIAGGLGANLNSDSCTLLIESTADQFEHNGNGWILLGGIASGTVFAGDNSVGFTAHGGTIQGSGVLSPPAAQLTGGLVAVGGTNSGSVADHVSHNVVGVELWGVTLRGNDSPDIGAWGAWTASGVLAGTYDRVSIALHGVTKLANVVPTPSAPPEPGGTNTVTIRR